jgi:hypothetical protein
VTWFSVAKSALKLVSGVPTRFESSSTGSRTFCPRCGTQLCFEDKRFPECIDVTVSSLDQPSQVPPKDHTHTSAKLAWLHLNDDLPRYPEQREA